jgi:hypothetical protein
VPLEDASPDLAGLALEHGALAGVPAQTRGACRFRPRLLGAAKPDQQLAPHTGQQMGASELPAGVEVIDDAQRRGWSSRHRQGDCPVQLDSTTGDGASRPSAS